MSAEMQLAAAAASRWQRVQVARRWRQQFHAVLRTTASELHYNKLCAWPHNMPLPLQVDNIFVFIHQVAPVSACWLFQTSATS